jgi:hypothetical protein
MFGVPAIEKKKFPVNKFAFEADGRSPILIGNRIGAQPHM